MLCRGEKIMRTDCKSVALAAALSILVAVACFALLAPRLFGADPLSVRERADRFLDLANAGYQALSRVQGEAQWDATTDVTPAHVVASEVAGKAYAAFNGNPAIINEAKDLLLLRAELNELTVRQLERALLNAAEGPMTNPKLTGNRVAAETAQASVMNSFEFKLRGKIITTNEIDDQLRSSNDLAERRAVWHPSNPVSRSRPAS
jgi:peptidyl-dipeptidase A